MVWAAALQTHYTDHLKWIPPPPMLCIWSCSQYTLSSKMGLFQEETVSFCLSTASYNSGATQPSITALVVNTGFTGQYGILVWLSVLVYTIPGYFWNAHRKVKKFPEGNELLINMADTHEIEYTLVPNTKGKSDLWKHFNLQKRKTDGGMDADVCKQCNSARCKACRMLLKHVNAYEAP